MARGKVVSVLDNYTIISNLGSNNSSIRIGQKFKVIKLGGPIIDPDTHEELGQLEIPCGLVEVSHIQEKMSTMKSCEYSKDPDKKEIKITNKNPVIGSSSFLNNMFRDAAGETVQTIIPGREFKKPLVDVEVGDIVMSI